MQCRTGCGACCIAPSITVLNKPAGVRCQHLTDENLCAIFGKPERPRACADFHAGPDVCGETNEEALRIITELEAVTTP